MADRILAQDITFRIQSETSGVTTGMDGKVMGEVDRFDGKYVPDILKTWPAGAKKYWHQLAGASYQVTMTAGQMGGGFLSLAAKQHQEVQLGKGIPKLRLTRTGATKNNTFHEVYVGGIVSAATNAQTTGNAAVTTDVTIEFEDMNPA